MLVVLSINKSKYKKRKIYNNSNLFCCKGNFTDCISFKLLCLFGECGRNTFNFLTKFKSWPCARQKKQAVREGERKRLRKRASSWRSQKFGSFALLGFAFNRFLCELATNVNSLQTHTHTNTHVYVYIYSQTGLRIQLHS